MKDEGETSGSKILFQQLALPLYRSTALTALAEPLHRSSAKLHPSSFILSPTLPASIPRRPRSHRQDVVCLLA